MLGERKDATAELAQWWDGVLDGADGSHAVLLVGPPGRGRSAILGELAGIVSQGGADAPASLTAQVSGGSLPAGPGQQADAVRDALLGAGIREQAAALLCRSRPRGSAWPGGDSLLVSGIADTMRLLAAGLAAAAGGAAAQDLPAAEDGAAARAARVVAAVSASAAVAVIIDCADCLDPGLAVTVIENLIRDPRSRVLVVAAVDLGSDLAAALTSRARSGPTTGRVHRTAADPRRRHRSGAEPADGPGPHPGDGAAAVTAAAGRDPADSPAPGPLPVSAPRPSA